MTACGRPRPPVIARSVVAVRGRQVPLGVIFHQPCVALSRAVGHMVMLHGCDVGDGSLIGIGSTILNSAKIGKNCLVGAHTLIPEGKVYPDNSMILGTPGKVVKTLTPEQIAGLRRAAEGYVANADRFRRTCRAVEDDSLGII